MWEICPESGDPTPDQEALFAKWADEYESKFSGLNDENAGAILRGLKDYSGPQGMCKTESQRRPHWVPVPKHHVEL